MEPNFSEFANFSEFVECECFILRLKEYFMYNIQV